jgi:hypothetical protein
MLGFMSCGLWTCNLIMHYEVCDELSDEIMKLMSWVVLFSYLGFFHEV